MRRELYNKMTAQLKQNDEDRRISKDLTFNLLAKKAQNHLIHIVSISNDRDKLLFNLAGFYGELLTVLRENKLIK